MTVQLLGEVDLLTVGRVEDLLGDLLVRGRRSVVVDLAGVTFLAAIGYGVLMVWSDRYRDAAGRLLLMRPTSMIYRIAALIDLDSKLSLIDVHTTPSRTPDGPLDGTNVSETLL